MKRVEAKTLALLTLPVLAVLVFAGVWNWRQKQLSALEAQREVQNVRVLESIVMRESAATTTMQRWRNEEIAEQQRLLKAGVSGLKQIGAYPPPKIAPQDGLLYRVTYFVPDTIAISSGVANATDLKIGCTYWGERIHRKWNGNWYIHEEIFDLSKMRRNGHIKFSVSLFASKYRLGVVASSRTITDTKVVDLTKL